jgi:choline-sulfatase
MARWGSDEEHWMHRQLPHSWLLISFDQWRGDWLRQPWLQLPHLQKLALESWVAERCYTSCPHCVPARASWLTGLSPLELGLVKNTPYTVPAEAPSFVRNLRDAGYTTALIGKTHWTPHNQPGVDLRDNLPLLRALGIDRAREIAGPRALAVIDCELTDLWREAGVLEAYRQDLADRYKGGCAHLVRPSVLPEALYPDLWVGAQAVAELQSMPTDSPWFLWVSFPGPHEPFDVPARWRGVHPISTIPDADPRPAWAENLPLDCQLRSLIARWPEGIPIKALKELRADYADHLALLDTQLGHLMEAINVRPDYDNIAVSVVSDHGELLGDWSLLLKGCFLEGAVRSLCLHRPPGGRGPWRAWGSRNPVPLTPALQCMAAMVRKGRRQRPLESLAARRGPVVSTFDGESLEIRGDRRTMVLADGRRIDLPLPADP